MRWALLLFFSACAGTVDLQGLSNACTTDSDCVAVYRGTACTHCPCPNSAISVSAKAAYDAEFSAAQKACPAGTTGQTCACTQLNTAHCRSNQCLFP